MLAAPTAELSTGYGAYLLHTTLALLAVCALAALVLRLLKGKSNSSTGELRVIARLSLEPRRSIYIVAAAGKYLVVGVGDGPMAVLAELDPVEGKKVEEAEAASQGAGLVELAKRALSGRK